MGRLWPVAVESIGVKMPQCVDTVALFAEVLITPLRHLHLTAY